MSKSKEIATISSNWQECELLKDTEGTYILRACLWIDGNLQKDEGQEMFDYLIEHHGLEFVSDRDGYGYVCASVETMLDFEDVLERMEAFDNAVGKLADVMDEDYNIRMDEAEVACDREK